MLRTDDFDLICKLIHFFEHSPGFGVNYIKVWDNNRKFIEAVSEIDVLSSFERRQNFYRIFARFFAYDTNKDPRLELDNGAYLEFVLSYYHAGSNHFECYWAHEGSELSTEEVLNRLPNKTKIELLYNLELFRW